LTLHNRFKCGDRKVGSIRMIPEAGFSGIAGISWGVVMKMTQGRSKDGKPSSVMRSKLPKIAGRGTVLVVLGSVRPSCTGLMIVGKYSLILLFL
jgi:hypothetical protein